MDHVENQNKSVADAETQRLVVIGGTGFVGRHLLDALSASSNSLEIIFAVHRNEPDWLKDSPMRVQRFDVENSASLQEMLTPGCTVLNLLRPDGSGWFLPAIEKVLVACRTAGIKRYIHVSSIDVFGASPASICTSSSPIVPVTPYEREHAAAEAIVRAVPGENFEALVLRLGAVFGVGGLNIVSFVKEVSSAPHWKLALRRSLYGARRMHLVSVEKVVEVLLFMITAEPIVQGEVIVVTEDFAPDNNFAFLQDTLMKAFGRRVFSHVPYIPPTVLRYVLNVRKVSNSDPMRRFRDDRLAELGMLDKGMFNSRLNNYVGYLRANA
ncbi:NAD-dependent epimerase/dehydratase family protein [Pseudomonas prosekii]|uniref:NAD-dependent epimerase/dehydratase family protein n=1 Tax=Pseudomonas prosekii TaxID=1148509 RepID=UPI0016568C47|nr:NAD(P)-dependent oxidoreductase [Pseudomonas prosekii]